MLCSVEGRAMMLMLIHTTLLSHLLVGAVLSSTGTMTYSLKTRLSQMAQDRQDAMEAMRMVVLEKEATDRWLGNE